LFTRVFIGAVMGQWFTLNIIWTSNFHHVMTILDVL
jgi:hypothetical protein